MMIDGRFSTEQEINAYITEIKAERDRAKDLLKAAIEEIEPREKACTVCLHMNNVNGDDSCKSCIMASNFEWRHHAEVQESISKKAR